MKVFLSSILTCSLFATLAAAQSSRSTLIEKHAHQADSHQGPGKRDLLVYVVTAGSQFGTVDLRTGEFTPIAVTPDLADLGIGNGLVQGPGRSLLSLAFSGDLDKIDPVTNKAHVIGKTGLADCSLPGSYDPGCANYIGQLGERYFATDFAQNLYSVDPRDGSSRLIGPTGIPPLTFAPFSENPDGSVNVFGESIVGAHGKLYAYYVALAVNLETGTFTIFPPGPAIYQIDPATGQTTKIASINSPIPSIIVNVNDTIYGFDGLSGQIFTVDLGSGHTKTVSVVHGAACEAGPPSCVIAGATLVRPLEEKRH